MNSALRVYTLLLRLYPAPYRSLLGREMSAVFRERLAECSGSGIIKPAGFISSEFVGMFKDLAVAWLSRIRHTGHDDNCGCIPDFRKMRPPWTEAKSYYRLLRAPRN